MIFRIVSILSLLAALSSCHLSELCPKLSWPLNEGACGEPKCRSNNDCEDTGICCTNGCVNTCYFPPDSVLAFDWSEEPAQKIRIDDRKDIDILDEGTVALPGGCILNMEQYIRFEDFKNNEYIEDCFCELGNILCHISHK